MNSYPELGGDNAASLSADRSVRGTGRQGATIRGTVRFAYADPPYVGQARKHYDAPEVDQGALIRRLREGEYDGWALSCSSPSLASLLVFCPGDVRLGAWVKPFASFKPNVNPAYAWEPVIFWGGRKRGRDLPTLRDWHSANITLRKGLAGAKPVDVCTWILNFLNVQAGDEMHDLFPGTRSMRTACVQLGAEYVPSTERAALAALRGQAGV